MYAIYFRWSAREKKSEGKRFTAVYMKAHKKYLLLATPEDLHQTALGSIKSTLKYMAYRGIEHSELTNG